MALNDAELVRLRIVFKRYEETISTMLEGRAWTASQVVHEHQKMLGKLQTLMRKFRQTEDAIGNAMFRRPRQQIGAFGPSQARSRLTHLNRAKADAEALIRRIAGLLDTAPVPIEFKHKGIVDIANKIEKQFTEIGEADNQILNDGPSITALAAQGSSWTLMFHLLILMLELTRAGAEAGVFKRLKK